MEEQRSFFSAAAAACEKLFGEAFTLTDSFQWAPVPVKSKSRVIPKMDQTQAAIGGCNAPNTLILGWYTCADDTVLYLCFVRCFCVSCASRSADVWELAR